MSRFAGLSRTNIEKFLIESNAIEGIHKPPTKEDIEWAEWFVLIEDQPEVESLEFLVRTFPGSPELRRRQGMGVRVGNHIPPPGGPRVEQDLEMILSNVKYSTPYATHVKYETLHPFLDGNGRSGRLLWLWQMLRQHGRFPQLGFLHTFYYQALDGAR